jgi:serine/threonine protein kinase
MNTNYYTFKIDIWSLGCIYYFVYTGKVLFPSENKTELSLIREIFGLTGTPDVRLDLCVGELLERVQVTAESVLVLAVSKKEYCEGKRVT